MCSAYYCLEVDYGPSPKLVDVSEDSSTDIKILVIRKCTVKKLVFPNTMISPLEITQRFQMRLENTNMISKKYNRLDLFLLKRNRNSLHNSSAQCFSLQSLWSLQPCQAPPFCRLGSASHWAQPLLHPTSSFLFTPQGTVVPSLPFPQCTVRGSSRNLSALPSLQSLLPVESWKWIRFSHKTANGQLATQPTLQRAIRFLGLRPGRKGCVL